MKTDSWSIQRIRAYLNELEMECDDLLLSSDVEHVKFLENCMRDLKYKNDGLTSALNDLELRHAELGVKYGELLNAHVELGVKYGELLNATRS